jgi:Serine carboxypeptidase
VARTAYDYTTWAKWFLRDDVLTALNVCGEAGKDAFRGVHRGCIAMKGFDDNDTFDYSSALARALDSGVYVTMYYGKMDTVCNYMGGLAVANTLPWTGKDSFASSGLEKFVIAGVDVGQMKSQDGLTFLQIESAGHMVSVSVPIVETVLLYNILCINRYWNIIGPSFST